MYLFDGNSRCLWPELKLVSCWGDASSAPYLEELRTRLPHTDFQPKGLLATEGVVSVPGPSDIPVLAADSGFFEFLDKNGQSWMAHEIIAGQRYEVVMTTAGGLYRYRTGDEILCTGHDGELPQLLFMGRIGLTSDLVGEKLSESFVTNCLANIPGFRMLVPDRACSGYVLVMDDSYMQHAKTYTDIVEAALRRNPHYAYARKIGQLAPLRSLVVDALQYKYTAKSLEQGARLGDIKPPNLKPEPEWLNLFRQGIA
jgi:hypothetical protein